MRKKLKIILLAVLLCLCLVFSACGKTPETPDNTDRTDGSGEIYGQDNGENSEAPDNTDNTDGNNQSKEITEMYITVNNNKLKVTLAENSTVKVLSELLSQGDITYTANANNFEIYGDIGHSLPTNNTQITSVTGDVLLWKGDNICIFFGSNSYSYTRIGKIEGYSAERLKEILAPSSTVRVTISLK